MGKKLPTRTKLSLTHSVSISVGVNSYRQVHDHTSLHPLSGGDGNYTAGFLSFDPSSIFTASEVRQ